MFLTNDIEHPAGGEKRYEEARRLAEEIGIDEQEACLLLRDGDLWITHPAGRYPLTGEEAVRQWREAVDFAHSLATMCHNPMINDATSQLLVDAADRADEALRRARERAESL